MITAEINQGSIDREKLVTKIVDQFAPIGRYDHVLDPLVRFNTYGAVRTAVLETTHRICGDYPQLSERIQTRFGMSGWE